VLLQSLGSCGTAGSAASRACAFAASTTHSSAAGRGHGQRECSSVPAEAACARTTPEVLLRSAQRGRRHRARKPAHGRLRQRGERRSRLARLRATIGGCVFRRCVRPLPHVRLRGLRLLHARERPRGAFAVASRCAWCAVQSNAAQRA
jgi:hypothetical protein